VLLLLLRLVLLLRLLLRLLVMAPRCAESQLLPGLRE
jgi:hypothetical protein